MFVQVEGTVQIQQAKDGDRRVGLENGGLGYMLSKKKSILNINHRHITSERMANDINPANANDRKLEEPC